MEECQKLKKIYLSIMLITFIIFILACSGLKSKAERVEMQHIQGYISACSLVEQQKIYNIPLSEDFQIFTIEKCKEYNIPCEIAYGVMEVESNFNFMAQNKNCIGIMQIHEINYNELNKKLCITNLKDPYQNIESGIYLLSNLYFKYGDWHKALVCYNLGETGAKNIIATKYSKKVLDYAYNLSNQEF